MAIKTGKTRKPQTRTHVSAAGSFVAVPDMFPNADDSIKNAIKLEFQTVFSEKHRVQNVFSTDKFLVDVAAIDASALDPKVIAKDCDFFKEIATRHPEELKQIIVAMQAGGAKGIEKAEKLAKKNKANRGRCAQSRRRSLLASYPASGNRTIGLHWR